MLLVLITYMWKMPQINAHGYVSEAKSLNFVLSLHLLPYFVHSISIELSCTGSYGFFQISFYQYQWKRIKTLCPRNKVSGYLVFNFFEKFFQEYHQSVKKLRSRSRRFVGPNLDSTVCRGHQQATRVGKELMNCYD